MARGAAVAGFTWLAGLGWLHLPSAQAAGDPALGQYLSSVCATCHQSNGRQSGGIPAIVGLPADQFVAMMLAYKTGQRGNEVMRTIVGRLTRDEVEALAAYYGDLRPQP